MKAILILGAAVWQDGPSPTLLRRTRHAAALWHQGDAGLVVPCGGLGAHPPSEAAAMSDILQDAGVPAHAIHLEDRSTTTFENIRFALPILRAHDVHKVTIVTDTYHARRAAMVARHFGLSAQVSCPRPQGLTLRAHLRELAALPVYAAKLRKTPRA